MLMSKLNAESKAVHTSIMKKLQSKEHEIHSRFEKEVGAALEDSPEQKENALFLTQVKKLVE